MSSEARQEPDNTPLIKRTIKAPLDMDALRRAVQHEADTLHQRMCYPKYEYHRVNNRVW